LVLLDVEASSAPLTHQSLTEDDYLKVLDTVKNEAFTSIIDHIRYFTSLELGYTGYLGCEAAAEYIMNFFRNLGLNVTYHDFNVTIPLEVFANFTLQTEPYKDEKFKIYSCEPNMVCLVTTPEITGSPIYVPYGQPSEFNNKTEDSIVLMNYNSREQWINALNLGAKAVISIEPEDTMRFETNQKSISLPLNFPRYYMPRKDATRLLEVLTESQEQGKALIAHLSSKAIWKQVTAKNIITVIPGEVDDIVVLSAHYDSGSVIPSLAPGAREAIGVSTLLELARFLKDNPTRYTLMFVAFSGHNQHLSGSRFFIDDFFNYEKSDYMGIARRILMQINLDLTTSSDIEATGICIFLIEYLNPHLSEMAEDFSLSSLKYSDGIDGNRELKIIEMEMRLAPYERGIRQNAQIILSKNLKIGRWSFEVFLERTGGERDPWIRAARNLINNIRKQLLLWRAIRPNERENYQNRGEYLESFRKKVV